ncbi:MAG: hypothetical protein COV46_00830 [Deltaproteobacteria bacterium CG11_big_fil_rev_8_21_14_0_20_49_13]|nr:MAG: hypothetical protein COV46_00830 [Deltaproteobacteria bacterium CG11_big_fil_rev_8_21_14_0_20_49_13]
MGGEIGITKVHAVPTEPVLTQTEELCFKETATEPIFGFMYVGGEVGGNLGFSRSNPATGRSYGVKANILGNGHVSGMVTVGGLGVGIMFNGSIMPAVGYKGVYFYGNGASIGIFNITPKGFSVAPFYVPLIIGALQTFPGIIQNAEKIEEMENPRDYIFGNLFKNIFYAALPIGLLEDIFRGKIDAPKLPDPSTKMGAALSISLLSETMSANKAQEALEVSRMLYHSAVKGHAPAIVRAELLNQYDVAMRELNRSDLPRDIIDDNLKWALFMMKRFHSNYKGWLEEGDGFPSRDEIEEYMTASLVAAQKLPVVTEKRKNDKCEIVKASAPVSFDGLEKEYMETMAVFSGFLTSKDSGIYKYIVEEQGSISNELFDAIKDKRSTDTISDIKFRLDAYTIWISNVKGLITDGNKRFQILKWRIKEPSLAIELADPERIETALRSQKAEESYVSYYKIKNIFDIVEEVYVLAGLPEGDNRSAIFAAAFKLEEMGWQFVTQDEKEIYESARVMVRDLLSGQGAAELLADAERRYEKFYQLFEYSLFELQDELKRLKNPRIDDHMKRLFYLYKGLPREFPVCGKGCDYLATAVRLSNDEVLEATRHTVAIEDIIENIEIDKKDKKNILEAVNKFLKKLRIYREKRNAIVMAEVLSNQGGRICQR